MPRNRLNLSALRQPRSLGAPTSDTSRGGTPLSRRQLLGLAGASAVGASAALRAGQTAWLGAFDLALTPGRAAFLLGGRERWVIDARRYAGTPALTVERGEDVIRLALTGARYPGTGLPADISCVLTRGLVGWKMTTQFALGGLKGQVRFERWLAGVEEMTLGGKMRPMTACALGEGSALTLAGRLDATYHPDGSLRLRGARVGALQHGGAEFAADTCTLALPGADTPSLLHQMPARRSTIRLERGAHAWPGAPLLPPAPEGMLTGDNVFDTLDIEAGESGRGAPRHALLAQSQKPQARLAFYIADGVTGHDGQPFRLPLHAPRAATAFDPAGRHHTALTAEHAPDPLWLRINNTLVQIGHPGMDSPFEMTGRGSRLRTLDYAPTLLAAAVPLAGAIADPLRFKDSPRLRLAADGLGPATTANAKKDLVASQQTLEALLQTHNGQVKSFTLPSDMSVSVLRADDLLAVRFEFYNLVFDANKTNLVIPPTPINQAVNSYIAVYFPPQNIAEQAFFETDPNFPDPTNSNETPTTPPVPSRAAGESRLVFQIATSQTPIPYTLTGLLTVISHSPMSVTPNAVPPYVDPGSNPDGSYNNEVLVPTDPGTYDYPVTAIELPWRLVLSPYAQEGWAHTTGGPVTHNGRTELWHTRLSLLSSDPTPQVIERSPVYLRAIWSPDYAGEAQPSHHVPGADTIADPFRTSLDPNDRSQLAGLMGTFIAIRNRSLADSSYRFMFVNRMMLTSLGGYLDSHYEADPPNSRFSVSEWDHRAAMGRDNYVRVVYKGTLLPFGHEAALIKVTERKFYRDPATEEYTAYLFQHLYIVVRQPVKTYTDPRMPFRSVRITTTVTPNLDDPSVPGPSAIDNTIFLPFPPFFLNFPYGQRAFWPQVGGQDFLFHAIGTDFEGQQTEFAAPLIFVDNTITAADLNVVINTAANGYHSPGNTGRRNIAMRGQPVAFAPANNAQANSLAAPHKAATPHTVTPHAAQPSGTTTYPAQFIAFAADLSSGLTPVFGGANIRIASAEQISGNPLPTAVQFVGTYVSNGGFGGPNAGEVFLNVVNDPLAIAGIPGVPDPSNLATTALQFATDKSGGISAPNLNISGLSRMLGPVAGDLSDAANSIIGGHFDPLQYFSNALNAKLLGAIKLSDILQVVGLDPSNLKVPQILSQRLPGTGGLPDTIQATLHWETDAIQTVLIFIPNQDGNTTKLILNATVTQAVPKATPPLPAGPPISAPTYDVMGVLNDFKLDLFGFIGITFSSFSFEIKSGQKASVNPRIADNPGVEFEGPLQFVDQLRQLIPTGDLSPATLDLTPTGVTAGLSLSLPSGGIGVFSIENISFGASLTIPFTGDPVRLRLNFSSREDPFLVSVSLIGGGGYFLIGLGADGVEMLEAAIDLGANVSIDLGVASGNIHILFGLAFTWVQALPDTGGPGVTLTAYLKYGGSLEVLGLITVSVELYLGLSYTTNKTIAGEASLTVEIDILFFSKSVKIDVRKEFHSDVINLVSNGHHPNERVAMLDEEASPLHPARHVAGLLASGTPSGVTPPKFTDAVPTQDIWNQYAAAFAA